VHEIDIDNGEGRRRPRPQRASADPQVGQLDLHRALHQARRARRAARAADQATLASSSANWYWALGLGGEGRQGQVTGAKLRAPVWAGKDC